ncbi:MAG: glycosyl hydrolase family 95 catalytic domain-containing protein [Anaerolineae bacterium]
MSYTHIWHFPLPRTHTGVLQGNGTLGVMIWGEGNVLRLTIGRADFWDHRGGMPWREGMSYAAIRSLLEAGDEEGLRRLFERTDPPPGHPHRPSVLPIGRVELVLRPDLVLRRATLDMDTGEVVVEAEGPDGTRPVATLALSMQEPVLNVHLTEPGLLQAIQRVPAWQYVGDHLSSISFVSPDEFDLPGLAGWVQERPADPPLCLAYRQETTDLWMTALYGSDPEDARAQARRTIEAAAGRGPAALREANAAWWAGYWRRVPEVSVPNPRLQFLYRYGMYKFAGLTNPDGVPATLQGPWIEEYQMPPWSSDYHFNINVQMCYWPAYRGNLLHHLPPLFDMIGSWQESLRHNARIFLGIDDGLMLPHAVDDRGTCMGGFWTGSVDHGCTAWVADMMCQYWRYTGDLDFLRETAYPFMRGVMRVYEGMLEERDGRLILPVGVSPEFGGAGLNAWGENASFQLACIHRLCRNLMDAARALGEEPEPTWLRIEQDFPLASLHGEEGEEQIALWDGLPLPESHRHHSHLAGIYPFDTLDLDDPLWRPIVERSLATWIREGMGMWSGWAMPWAAILHSRVGNADMAELVLETWERVFTNQGHGTLHDPDWPGFTLIGSRPTAPKHTRGEIMQMDAGMGVTAATMELLLQTRRGVNHLFAGAPSRWNQVSFRGIRTEGGFLVSAAREDGQVTEVEVTSDHGGEFRLANPWGEAAIVSCGDGSEHRVSGQVLKVQMRPGESCTIRPARSG